MAEIKNNDFTIRNITSSGNISATGDITASTSSSGTSRIVTVANTDNGSTSSIAKYIASVGGASAGDAFSTYTIIGAQSWSQGASNTTGDDYRLVTGTDLTSGTVIESVNTNGFISYPNQLSFLAFLQNNVTNATGAGTAYTIAYDQIQFQRGGSNFNTTTGVYTIPTGGAGIYLFTFTINLENIGALVTEGTMSILTTSRNYRGFVGNPFAMATSGNLGITASVIAEMSETDTAEVQISFSGDAADNVTVSQFSSQFSGWKLG